MEELIGRIAQFISDMTEVQAELVQAEADELAVDLQTQIIDPLQEVATDIDSLTDSQKPHTASPVEAAGRMPNIRLRKKAVGLKWACCKPPKRIRIRRGPNSGQQAWASWCAYKKGSKTGGMVRIVKRPKDGKLGPAPKTISLGGKKIKKC